MRYFRHVSVDSCYTQIKMDYAVVVPMTGLKNAGSASMAWSNLKKKLRTFDEGGNAGSPTL